MIKRNEDRRKHPRFSLKGDALAVLKPHPIKLGQIVNISEGGIAIHYIQSEKTTLDYNCLDIFITTEDVKFNEVPFHSVKDFTIPVKSIVESCDNGIVRQSCIEFPKLTNSQKKKLKQFIKKHTVTPDYDRRSQMKHFYGFNKP